MDRFDEDWGWLPHGDDTIKTCVRGLIGFNLMIGAEAEDDFLGKEKRCSFIIVFVQKALCSTSSCARLLDKYLASKGY